MRGVASSATCRDGKQANELLVMRIKQGSGNKHKARAATRLRAVSIQMLHRLADRPRDKEKNSASSNSVYKE